MSGHCKGNRRFSRLGCVAACLLFAGCGSALTTADLAGVDTGAPPEPVAGTPTDLYTRIARGALTCWFGARGPLKGAYIYHAEADSEAKGGRAEIVIHVKDPAIENPRGLRAFRVAIASADDKATLAIENLKMPGPLGSRMKADVHRWAAGEVGCEPVGAEAGWTPHGPGESEPAPATNTARKTAPRK